MTAQCDCGASTEGKWADVHSTDCAVFDLQTQIADLIRSNVRAVEGWPITIDGIEEAAAAIVALTNNRNTAEARERLDEFHT